MNRAALQFAFRCLSVAAICVGLAATGFAHRGFAAPRNAALTDYLAAGGMIADICGDIRKGKDASAQSCEACRLVGAAVVPETCVVLRPLQMRPAAGRIGVQCVCAPPARLDLSRPTRAPPHA